MEQLFGTPQTASPGGRILVIDDDPIAAGMLCITLNSTGYTATEMHSGELALEGLTAMGSAELPDIIFLDIVMAPGIDGYETCRRLREHSATQSLPVLFLSGQDSLEDRLQAYDAGGSDFLAKPFNPVEVLHKARLAILHKRREDASALEQRTTFDTAMTALTSLGEFGVALKFSRAALGCRTLHALANKTIESMTSFGLDCHVQFRVPTETLTLTTHGAASPLECSVIDKMRDMGRIFSFKNRSIINYDGVSLLLVNMPTHDADLCGRIRDYAAMIAEAAELSADNINLRTEAVRRAADLHELAVASRSAVEALHNNYRDLQFATRSELEHMTSAIEGMFTHLGLTNRQEFSISDTVRASTDKILTLFDKSSELDANFAVIAEGLSRASDYTVSQEDDAPPAIDLW